jgi:glycosyltransferase involved in cell wall biosynthesis
MIRVLHLVDDPNLGGINRLLDMHAEGLGSGFAVSRQVVDTRAAPPRDIAADVVVVHFTLAWRKLLFLLRLRLACARIPLILVEHSYTAAYEQHCVARPRRFRAMLKLGARLVDQVVAVSHGQLAWLRDTVGLPGDRLRVIEPTSDLAPFEALPPLAPHAGPLRLGCCGRYAPQKGLFLLVEAMRVLPPGTATLAMVGYGPDEAALRAAARDLPAVSIGGPTDRPDRFLTGIDAIVMPSLWEAYGLVCAESRAAGRPVLVADIDGLGEQVPAALRIAGPTAAAIAERITWLAAQDLPRLGESLRGTMVGAPARHFEAWSRLLREMAPRAA